MTVPATDNTTLSLGAGSAEDPAYLSAAYTTQRDRWNLLDDVLGGTSALRLKAELYLPRAPGESQEKYDRRLARSRFYNFYRRTLRALVGRVMRKAPKLADGGGDAVDPLLLAHAENIDGQGAHFAVFTRRFLSWGMHYGFGGILVDVPPDLSPRIGRQPTLADERAAGIRPYWVPFSARQILSHRTAVIGGVRRLIQIVLLEDSEEEDGAFGAKRVLRYRVLRRSESGPPTFQVYERLASGPGAAAATTGGPSSHYRVVSEGQYRNQTEIPFSAYYAEDPDGWFQAQPKLIDLAEINLDHYAVQSDHRHSLHVASIPIPVLKGVDEEQGSRAWSVERGIYLPADGDAFYLEHEGRALAETRSELRDLEDRMGVLAMSQMARRTNQAETAESKRLDSMDHESSLATAARGLQDTLEQAWGFHAQYLGVVEPEVVVNFDFDGLTLGTDQIREAREGWLSGVYSLDTLLDILEAGGALPEAFDREADQERVAEESARRLVLVPGAGDDLDQEDTA